MITHNYYCVVDRGTYTIVHRPTGQIYILYALDDIRSQETTDLVGIFQVDEQDDDIFEMTKLINYFCGATCYKEDEMFRVAIDYLDVYYAQKSKKENECCKYCTYNINPD